MAYRAEYIWIDGTEPVPLMRSKTKILPDGAEVGVWGFDGSSTNQAQGANSDCVLSPVFITPDPIRGGDDKLVLCEVLVPDTMQPHPTNRRAAAVEMAKSYADQEPWFGMEQEYTFFEEGRPMGWPRAGYYYPAPRVLITAGWVRSRSPVARSWRLTPMPAWPPAWPSRAPMPR